jgi:hypothetical protein
VNDKNRTKKVNTEDRASKTKQIFFRGTIFH